MTVNMFWLPQQFVSFAHIRQPTLHVLVQNQQWKHQSNVKNMFQVNNRDIKTTSTTLSWCLYCYVEQISHIVVGFPLLKLCRLGIFSCVFCYYKLNCFYVQDTGFGVAFKVNEEELDEKIQVKKLFQQFQCYCFNENVLQGNPANIVPFKFYIRNSIKRCSELTIKKRERCH